MKEIRLGGVVKEDYKGFILCNKSEGEQDCDNSEGYGYTIQVDSISSLGAVGITDFKECKDKRQIAIIERDVLPETEGYSVLREDEDTLSFGCGAVSLEIAEIEAFVRVRKQLDKLTTPKERYTYSSLKDLIEDTDTKIGDFTPESYESLGKIVRGENKILNSKDGRIYGDIREKILSEGDITAEDVSLDDVAKLLKAAKNK